jgi:threonylcarbamoyladenosine tRNA methylthiotransferase MtaB
MTPQTVAFYTLGCKLNFSESSALGRQFEERGVRRVEFEQGADVYVVNTCSVTDHADRKCRRVVQQALKHNPQAFVAIVGCYAQLKPQEIAEIPGVGAVLGASEKFRLAEILSELELPEAGAAAGPGVCIPHQRGARVSPGAVAWRAHAHFPQGAGWLRLLVLVLHHSAGAGG